MIGALQDLGEWRIGLHGAMIPAGAVWPPGARIVEGWVPKLSLAVGWGEQFGLGLGLCKVGHPSQQLRCLG